MTDQTPATWSLQSPAAPGPIGIIQLTGDIDAALARLAIDPVATGDVRLRCIAGVDTGLVARWTDTCAHLMPHAGPAVMRAILGALDAAGLAPAARAHWPEARDEIESRMLDALARAASPLAIDLLLDQPRRHREPTGKPDPALDGVLDRLIDPPLVVAIGAPNIGKSTLANALARRTVAIVADEPGTTRDHVGVAIDVDGLVIHYVDTPGIAPAATDIDRDAASIAADLTAQADLVLRCFDRTTSPPGAPPTHPSLAIALRLDLGPPSHPCDVSVGALTGQGIDDLARALRGHLVPDAALADPRPWQFWTHAELP
jgi:hypothetical protein